jgi:dihydropyrimidinase
MRTLLRNGRLVLGDRLVRGGVLIDGERIVAAGTEVDEGAERVFDLQGRYVLPGFVDLHVHLDDRIGRFELADSYRSGSEVAIRSGITTLCSFITQGASETLEDAIARTLVKCRGESHCDLHWHVTPTRFGSADLERLDGLLDAGWRTFKLYTTYRNAGIFSEYPRIADLFRRLGPKGARFLVHCEDDASLRAAFLPDAERSRALAHARIRPPKAEWTAVQKLLSLAAEHGTRLHVVHVSTAEAAEAILEHRAHGKVTCETCPQYLWLDEGWLEREQGHRWVCSPPLRKRREDFRALARDGAFDVFATDHCAFRRRDKDDWDGNDVRTVANGLPGLGALVPLVWRLFEDDPDQAALELAKRVSENPARVAGLWPRKGLLRPGSDADLAVLDPDGPEHPIRCSLADVHEPYAGFRTRLSVPLVVRRGVVVVEEGFLLEENPGGIALPIPVERGV